MLLWRWSTGRSIDRVATTWRRICLLRVLKFNAALLLAVVSVIGVESIAGVVVVGRCVSWDRRVLVVAIIVSTLIVSTLVIARVVRWTIVAIWSLASHPSCAVHWLKATAAAAARVNASVIGQSFKK